MGEVQRALADDEWDGTSGGFTRPNVTFIAHEADGHPYEALAYGMSADGDATDLRISDTVWHGEARHALAALALHGQPFGFTHHDLWVIDTLLRDAYFDPMHPGALGFRDDVRSLRDRIAALLPPRAGEG